MTSSMHAAHSLSCRPRPYRAGYVPRPLLPSQATQDQALDPYQWRKGAAIFGPRPVLAPLAPLDYHFRMTGGRYDGTSSTVPERNLTSTTRDPPRKIPRRCNRIQQRPGKQPAFKLSTGSIVAWPRHCICMRYYQHQQIDIDRSNPRRLMCIRRHHVSSPSLSSFVVVVVVVLVVKIGGLIRASMQPSTVLPPMALSLSYNVWALDWPNSGAQSLPMLTSFGLDSCLGTSDTQLDRLFVQGTCSSPASSAPSTLLVDVPASVPPSGVLLTILDPSPLIACSC
ncbi:predicted protein [Verticillium alfalfae VaMs.102]|uniref:Predicted protein n=1 Tax=Verticillium alfalfae (strain VaMs.102 / ATCC MYA-4576 / FGSC 10136) TaxID=526221 RepID=C9S966_VERA1|nr:predicted protein [Verticillium alfalfae VaMs.102]EEY14114.1 predicted protein [Verticillium alfalfae VaMs.102]